MESSTATLDQKATLDLSGIDALTEISEKKREELKRLAEGAANFDEERENLWRCIGPGQVWCCNKDGSFHVDDVRMVVVIGGKYHMIYNVLGSNDNSIDLDGRGFNSREGLSKAVRKAYPKAYMMTHFLKPYSKDDRAKYSDSSRLYDRY